MYWVKEVNLAQADQNELVSGKKLTDKHINGCCQILSRQFPDMPPIQSTLLSQTLALLRQAQSKEFFFHHFSDHWALSHLAPEGVLYYDSLAPKSLHPDLKNQLIALYGKGTVKIMAVQKQKGQKDCGCFAVAFCVSILYGESPEALTYQQADMRTHIKLSVESQLFTPFPSVPKNTRNSCAMDIVLD